MLTLLIEEGWYIMVNTPYEVCSYSRNGVDWIAGETLWLLIGIALWILVIDKQLHEKIFGYTFLGFGGISVALSFWLSARFLLDQVDDDLSG